MEKNYNPARQRWEVTNDNPLVHGGEEIPVFVSEEESACDAYISRCEKSCQHQTILKLVEQNGYIDRWMASCNGVLELASRIGELEEMGIKFKRAIEKTYYPDGKYKSKHMVYSL